MNKKELEKYLKIIELEEKEAKTYSKQTKLDEDALFEGLLSIVFYLGLAFILLISACFILSNLY